MNKLHVIMVYEDARYREWEANQTGYISGYLRGGDDRPYAVVVIGKKLVMVPLTCIEVLDVQTDEEEVTNGIS